MDEIPEDVMREAERLELLLEDEMTDLRHQDSRADICGIIARAIMAERERCAGIADDMLEVIPMWERPGGPPGNGPKRLATPQEVAAAIRKSPAP